MQLFYVQFWLILIFRSVWSVCNMSAYKNECYRTQFLNKNIFRFKLKSILLISTIYFQISEDKSTAVAAVAANSSCGCCGSKSEIKWRTDQLGFIRCFAWNSTKFLTQWHKSWDFPASQNSVIGRKYKSGIIECSDFFDHVGILHVCFRDPSGSRLRPADGLESLRNQHVDSIPKRCSTNLRAPQHHLHTKLTIRIVSFSQISA